MEAKIRVTHSINLETMNIHVADSRKIKIVMPWCKNEKNIDVRTFGREWFDKLSLKIDRQTPTQFLPGSLTSVGRPLILCCAGNRNEEAEFDKIGVVLDMIAAVSTQHLATNSYSIDSSHEP